MEAELKSLSSGTESSAIPRVGDMVEMKILGSDPQNLQGDLAALEHENPPGATKADVNIKYH